jgi:hypothetical protein
MMFLTISSALLTTLGEDKMRILLISRKGASSRKRPVCRFGARGYTAQMPVQ